MTSTAIIKTKGDEFRKELEQWAPDIARAATHGFTPERVLSAVLQAAVNEPKIFQASQTSLYLAILKTARWALDIGDTVHLVPMQKKVSKRGEPDKYITIVEAWPDYKGLKALAIRQKIVRSMEEYVVYDGDKFSYCLGLNAMLDHQPCGNPKSRGKITGAYTVIRLMDRERTFNYMPIEDIEAIRAKSKQWSTLPTCPPWYAMKTVVRNWLNRQPKQGAMAEALASDDVPFDAETGELLTPDPALTAQSAAASDEQIDQELAEREGRLI